jgi:hypothetical protein
LAYGAKKLPEARMQRMQEPAGLIGDAHAESAESAETSPKPRILQAMHARADRRLGMRLRKLR